MITMTAVALFVVGCWIAETVIGLVGALIVAKEMPPQTDVAQTRRLLLAGVYAKCGPQIKAIRMGKGVAGAILVLMVLL